MIRKAAAAALLGIALGAGVGQPPALRCAEDSTGLTGIGQFSDGRWSAYECAPVADDSVGFTQEIGSALFTDGSAVWEER